MTVVEESKKTSAIPGLAVVGLFAVGIASVAMAVGAAFLENFAGSGLCMIAAALSFGMIAHVSFR